MGFLKLSEGNKVIVIGGHHQDFMLKILGKPSFGRTNPVSTDILSGGVSANLARALSTIDNFARIYFIGAVSAYDNKVGNLNLFCDDTKFVEIVASAPTYTAILDNEGELLIGLADMGLYEKVKPHEVVNLLPANPRIVIIDANFPQETLKAVARTMHKDAKLFAVGTSVEKVDRLFLLLDRLDAIVLNRAEARKLASLDVEVEELAINVLAKMQRPDACVLISDGADKAALAFGGDVVVCSPPVIKLNNANGAGDAMAAAFFKGYLDWCGNPNDTRAASRKLFALLHQSLAAGAAHAASGNHA